MSDEREGEGEEKRELRDEGSGKEVGGQAW